MDGGCLSTNREVYNKHRWPSLGAEPPPSEWTGESGDEVAESKDGRRTCMANREGCK